MGETKKVHRLLAGKTSIWRAEKEMGGNIDIASSEIGCENVILFS
jgi:hypothetical protein